MYCLLFEARIVRVYIRFRAKIRVYIHIIKIISNNINQPKLIPMETPELRIKEVLSSKRRRGDVLSYSYVVIQSYFSNQWSHPGLSVRRGIRFQNKQSPPLIFYPIK